MPMRLDGADVLRRVIDNPEVFPLSADIDGVARKVVVTRMKAASSVADVKTICSTLGETNFKMVADGITDAEAKAIVGKVDKENKEAKTAGGPAQRVLLVELATGKVEPRAKAIKEKAPKKAPARATSAAGKGIRAASAGAKRQKAE